MRRKTMIAAALAMTALGGCGGGTPNQTATGAVNPFGGGGTAAPGGDGDIVLTRDAAVGALYGAPGPRTCSPDTVPASGQPSAEQIAKYVICGREGKTGDSLFLVDQVQVTAISAGRPYNPNEDVNMSKIDINMPIYDIAGSLTRYQCNQVTQPGQYDGGEEYHPGKQCWVTTEPKATGLCYLNTLHQWWCSMQDTNSEDTRKLMPPPPAD